MSFQQISGRSA